MSADPEGVPPATPFEIGEIFSGVITDSEQVARFTSGEDVALGIGQEEMFPTRKKGRKVNYKLIENPTYPKNIGSDLRAGEDALSTLGQSTLIQFTVHKRRSQRAIIKKEKGGFIPDAQFANPADEASNVSDDITRGNIQNLQELAALGVFPDDGAAFFAFEQAQEAARDPQAEAVQQASADARLDQTTLGNPLGLNAVDDFLGQAGVQTTGLSDEQAQRFVEAVSQDVRITRADDQVLEKIRMYVPAGLQFDDSVTFQNASPGIFQVINESLAGNVGSAMESLTLGAAGALAGAAKGIAESIEDLVGAGGLSNAFSGGKNLFLQARLGISSNPRTEVAFGGVSRKTFSLGFNMAPRDEEEALHMLNIIEAFRFHMMPELSLGGAMLLAPHEFDIKFMMTSNNKRGGGIDSLPYAGFMENPHLPKLGRCYLTSVNVNYAPNNRSAFYHDGVPTEVQLSLNFQQAFLSNRQFILGGF